MKQSMSFAAGFSMSGRRAVCRPKVFDWDKAARLILEHQPHEAEAGLAEDWSCTSGTIWRGGEPVKAEDTYVYLSSNWATPLLDMDGEEIECWVYEKDTEWDSGTIWPQSALGIIYVDAEVRPVPKLLSE